MLSWRSPAGNLVERSDPYISGYKCRRHASETPRDVFPHPLDLALPPILHSRLRNPSSSAAWFGSISGIVQLRPQLQKWRPCFPAIATPGTTWISIDVGFIAFSWPDFTVYPTRTDDIAYLDQSHLYHVLFMPCMLTSLTSCLTNNFARRSPGLTMRSSNSNRAHGLNEQAYDWQASEPAATG